MMFGNWSGFGFQSPSSPMMEGVIDLHNHIFFFLILVFVFVFWIFGNILYHFWWKVVRSPELRSGLLPLRKASHNTPLEVIWTLIPSFILVAIAVPSFSLLYAMDEVTEPALTLKVVGHQWYWTYQYSNCLANLRYSVVDHPEWVPRSLWERTWLNALYFYDTRITPHSHDDGYESLNIQENWKFSPEDAEHCKAPDHDKAAKEVSRLVSEFGWYGVTKKAILNFTDFNQLTKHKPKTYRWLHLADLYEVLSRARPHIPGPPERFGWDISESTEAFNRIHRLKEDAPKMPEDFEDLQLAAWANLLYGKYQPVVDRRRITVRPINVEGFDANFGAGYLRPMSPKFSVWDMSTIRTLCDRLAGVHKDSLPAHESDFIWFSEYFARKLIAGKVSEALAIKVNLNKVGSQLPGVQFDSYMLNEEELSSIGDYRLLEVDEPVLLPSNTQIRLLITADDVIHSFALPQLGVKVDAVPGRLNQQGLFIKREGTFYGQCSELCGVNHGFMPIVVKSVGSWEFMDWYLKKFDSIFPEYGFTMTDPQEVKDFLYTGKYPDTYAPYFNHNSHVSEPFSGSKINSIFDQTPTHHTAHFEAFQNYHLNRWGLWHQPMLESNWGFIQILNPPRYRHWHPARFPRPADWEYDDWGPIFGQSLSYDFLNRKSRPLVWGASPLYYKISLSHPSDFVKQCSPSYWTVTNMADGFDRPVWLDTNSWFAKQIYVCSPEQAAKFTGQMGYAKHLPYDWKTVKPLMDEFWELKAQALPEPYYDLIKAYQEHVATKNHEKERW